MTPGHQEVHLLALLPTLAVVGVAAVLPPHDAALEDHVGHLDGAAVACAAPRTCGGGYTSLGPIQLEHRRAWRAARAEHGSGAGGRGEASRPCGAACAGYVFDGSNADSRTSSAPPLALSLAPLVYRHTN